MAAPADPPGDPPADPPAPPAGARDQPAAVPVRRRASTASVITGVADRVVHAAGAIGERVGDVVGESLSHLPVVPKTRRGRVLARSILISFCLVFAWISVIVGLQLRGRRPPDLRPQAEEVLIALRDGHVTEVYARSSERFQEVELEETFVAKMEDLNRTLGRFREITAVVATETNRGPGGRTGRVDVRLEFERTATRGSLSFLWDRDHWELLGLGIEVPEALVKVVGTPEARRDRVQGNVKEFTALVTSILTRSFGGHADEVWREAAPGLQQNMSLDEFLRNEADRLRTLGPFQRVLTVSSARINPNLTGASVDAVLEFGYVTIKGSFLFTKIDGVWRMWGYKLVMPLPRIPT